MLVSIVLNTFCLITIIGYSYISKKFLCAKKEIILNNTDIFYGLALLLFFSLLFNFVFPLGKISYLIFISGIFIFFKERKRININIFKYILLISLITILSFYNGNNVDSPMYHLQLLKWIQEDKIAFGISNLEIRFAMNSSWHSIISILDIKLMDFSLKYYLNILALSFIVYEALKYKFVFDKKSLLIFFSINFLIIFSYLHPFRNGVILNHLGNPETDIFSMVSFIFAIAIFLNLKDKNFSDKNLINLIFIASFLSVTTRLTNLPLILILFYVIYKNNFKNLFSRVNIFLVIISFLWMLRSFFLSGCLIFPISISCLSTKWSLSLDNVKFHLNEAMSITRDAPFKTMHKNHEYTLYSYDWLIPWINNYFLETALLQISSVGILIFAFLLFILNIKKLTKIDVSYYILLISFLSIFYIWFKAPEIRYAWGPIIVLPCLLATIFFHKNYLFKFHKNLKYFGLVTIIPIILLLHKNLQFVNFKDFLISNKKKFNYSNIYKVKEINGVDIYKSKNWQCADFSKICVNTVKNISINNYYGYKVYLNQDK